MIGTLPLCERLGLTLDGLYRAVAGRIAGGAMAAALILLVCGRVRRIEARVLALLARFRAGRLWVRTTKPGGGQGGAREAASARLPLRFGWLLPLVPCQAAGFASQLRGVLDDPEMVALLAESIQARRVLAPLCRMLGIEASVLRGGIADEAGLRAAPAVETAARKQVRPPRPKVDWGRIPLPRGVLAAARRQGFGRPPAS